MKPTRLAAVLLLASTTLLTGCATEGPQQTSTPYSAPSRDYRSNLGIIDSIQVTRTAPANSGAGMVIGGLVGGLLGTQVGGGDGRTLATVAGAVGGAVVGNKIEQNRNAPTTETYQIHVRLNNGSSSTIAQSALNGLQVGDRVQIVDGSVRRY